MHFFLPKKNNLTNLTYNICMYAHTYFNVVNSFKSNRIFNVQLVINTEFVNFIAQSLSYTKSFLYQNMFFAYNWCDTVEHIRSGSLFHLVVNLSPFQSYRLLR